MSILDSYSAAGARAEQMALLDQLLYEWAEISGLARSLEERAAWNYKMRILEAVKKFNPPTIEQENS